MSIATADNFKPTNPKPFSEWDLYPNGDGTYRHWASTSEVTSYFAAPGMSPSWAKYKFFWIAGVYTFYTGTEFIPIGAPGNIKGIATVATSPQAGATPTSQYIYFAGPGTFANFPGTDGNPIILTENLNIISWDGTKATVQPIPIDVDLSGKTDTGGSTKTTQDLDDIKADKTLVEPSIDKTDQAFNLVPGGVQKNITTQDLAVATYGPNYGWGFPIGVYNNIIKIGVYVGGNGIGQIRLVLRKVDSTGEVLMDHTFLGSFINGVNVVNLPDIIANEDGDRLWLEYYGNLSTRTERTGATAQIFTQAAGYAQLAYTTNNDMGASGFNHLAGGYMDIYAEIYTSEPVIEFTSLMETLVKQQLIQISARPVINQNLRLSVAGSSVPWDIGRLATGFIWAIIKYFQEEVASIIKPADLSVSGLEVLSDPAYYDKQAVKLTGAGASIEFPITGDEVTICTAMERSNANASLTDVYVDDELIGTIDNTNTDPIGHNIDTFTGNGTDTKFDLGRPFTFNHIVKVNGVTLEGQINLAQTGAVITDDYLIIRKLGGTDIAKPQVDHWLWLKTAPATGAVITVEYDYGHLMAYEKTTIGNNGAGLPESPSGDGSKSFDTTQPANVSSGLDFRETNEKVLFTYRFNDIKTRNVKLVIRGLAAGSIGTPYFIFNFATNRIFYFQNAGIGGASLFDLNKSMASEYLTNWQRIAEWNPDILLTDVSNNEDWQVKGQKLYTSVSGLTQTQYRRERVVPMRSILYDTDADSYTVERWIGKIGAISEVSVTISDDTFIQADPAPGDYIMMGFSGTNIKEQIVRKVSSYDSASRTISFDKPIRNSDLVVESLSDLIGMELRVRDMSVFNAELTEYLGHLKGTNPDLKVGIFDNPYPNLSARELWPYDECLKDELTDIKNVHFISPDSLRVWQNTQELDQTVTIDASTLLTDPVTGWKYADFTGTNDNNNIVGRPVIIVSGADVYGKNSFLQSGWFAGGSYTGTAANTPYDPNNLVSKNTTTSAKPARIYFHKNAPTTGMITIRYSSKDWSKDNTHQNNDNSGIVMGQFLKGFIESIL